MTEDVASSTRAKGQGPSISSTSNEARLSTPGKHAEFLKYPKHSSQALLPAPPLPSLPSPLLPAPKRFKHFQSKKEKSAIKFKTTHSLPSNNPSAFLWRKMQILLFYFYSENETSALVLVVDQFDACVVIAPSEDFGGTRGDVVCGCACSSSSSSRSFSLAAMAFKSTGSAPSTVGARSGADRG